MGENQDTKKCLSCKDDLHIDAKLCANCKSFQSSWKNELKYWASITSLIVFVFTSIAVTTRFVNDLYNQWFQPDLAISSINTSGPLALWNLTKTDIWLTTLKIQSAKPDISLMWEVYKTVKKKEPIDVDMRELTLARFDGVVEEIYTEEVTGLYKFTMEPEILEKFNNNDEEVQKQFAINFMKLNSAEYYDVENLAEGNLDTVTCKMELSYIKSDIGVEKTISIPCVGLYRYRK
jgi:hypothetical protein